MDFGQFLPKPLSVDPVKPEDSDLCGDDPVSDVEPLAGPKDSPERLLPISKRPAPVIGLQIEMTSIGIPI